MPIDLELRNYLVILSKNEVAELVTDSVSRVWPARKQWLLAAILRY